MAKLGNRFQARIQYRTESGVKVAQHLGMFATAEDAHRAYLVAAKARWGDFLPVEVNIG